MAEMTQAVEEKAEQQEQAQKYQGQSRDLPEQLARIRGPILLFRVQDILQGL